MIFDADKNHKNNKLNKLNKCFTRLHDKGNYNTWTESQLLHVIFHWLTNEFSQIVN